MFLISTYDTMFLDRYALELHMLHMNTDKQTGQNKTAVIAVLYKIGKPNAFLSKVCLADPNNDYSPLITSFFFDLVAKPNLLPTSKQCIHY